VNHAAAVDTVVEAPRVAEIPEPPVLQPSGGKIFAYITLTKPRIAVLVLFTVAVGYVLGTRLMPGGSPLALLGALAGTGLVAAGASVWNQVLERSRDARMKRTAQRPLPTGRVGLVEAAVFGAILCVSGVAILALGAHPLAAVVGLATFVLYVFVYTPMKPLSTLNTAVGAIPGALPPVIGWAAATGRLGIEAWALFLIVFLWQFPHFFAIAWIYREDYLRGGHRMLPSADPSGLMTGRQSTIYALALLPVGLLPTIVGLAGPVYFAGAIVLGLLYLVAAVRFWRNVNDATARTLLRVSFLYLPLILLLLLINPASA
jgi:protoheme IX farnesyltransferase